MEREKILYNSEQKDIFKEFCLSENIYSITTLLGPIDSLFRTTAKNEKLLDKDVCEFNKSDITVLLKVLSTHYPNRISLKARCTYLGKYVDWCIQQKLTENIENIINSPDIDTLISHIIPQDVEALKYFSKDILQSYLENIRDVTDRFIAYSFFLGVNNNNDYEEISNIKLEDLDENRRILRLITGREIPVDDYYIKLIKEANSSLYYDKDETVNPDDPKLCRYTLTKYILKPMIRTDDKLFSVGMIRPRIRTIIRQSGNPKLNYSTLQLNGLIYYIQRRYRMRKLSLKRALILEKKNKREYKYEKDTDKYIKDYGMNTPARSLRKKISKYIDIYSSNEDNGEYNPSDIPSISIIDLLPTNKSNTQIQEELFITGLLVNDNCIYKYKNKELTWENNAILLFRINDYIISCARLDKIEYKENDYNRLYLYPDSIQLFNPINYSELITLYPDIKEAIETQQSPSIELVSNIFLLIAINSKNSILSLKCRDTSLKATEKAAKKLSIEELKKRIENGNMIPKHSMHVSSQTIYRNPYLKELVKNIADGICQLCREPAPFYDSDGHPFLEEHHVIHLSDGGPDTLDNVVALCPNCHRKSHILVKDEKVMSLTKVSSKNQTILNKLLIKEGE